MWNEVENMCCDWIFSSSPWFIIPFGRHRKLTKGTGVVISRAIIRQRVVGLSKRQKFLFTTSWDRWECVSSVDPEGKLPLLCYHLCNNSIFLSLSLLGRNLPSVSFPCGLWCKLLQNIGQLLHPSARGLWSTVLKFSDIVFLKSYWECCKQDQQQS